MAIHEEAEMEGYRTFIAAAVALLGEGLKLVRIEIDTKGVMEAIMIVGGLVGTIIFRYKATKVYAK